MSLLDIYRYGGKKALNDFIDNKRRTGKSLSHAFSLIGEAMKTGTTINITDYEPYLGGIHSNKEIIRITTLPHLEKIILDMGLEGFDLDKDNLTLTYDYTKRWE